ncbi:MAG: hypothetical protein RIR62_1241 [Pseudomonadota bacterium]
MTPQSRALPVLLTRPEAAGDRFAAELAAAFGDGLVVVTSPLLAPHFLMPALPQAEALVLTSETAVAAAVRLRDAGARLPPRAWCVGDRTAEAARAAGFGATSAKGDADALVALILSTGGRGPFLHLHGAETRGDVVGRLQAAGLSATGVVVYDQRPMALTDAARALLDATGPVLVPLFSPRTAALFAETAPHRAALWVAALSPAVSGALGALPVARRAIAARPDAAAMLAAIAALIGRDA